MNTIITFICFGVASTLGYFLGKRTFSNKKDKTKLS